MQLCVVLVCVYVCVCARAASSPELYDLRDAAALFNNFTHTHNKLYPSEEERAKRFEIFKETLKIINERNSKRQFDHEAFYGITQFADQSASERLPTCLLEDAWLGAGCTVGRVDVSQARPESLDWHARGKVTSPKNQDLPFSCGSCWAFSAVSNIESQYAIKHNAFLDLSEQQLVDCDETSNGCSGGLSQQGLVSIMKLGGIQSESDYPYVARKQRCSFDINKVKVQVKGCTTYAITDELKQLKSILNTVGPVSISLGVSDPWHIYKGGIMSLRECPAAPITDNGHSLLLVGYGVEGGVAYWTLKNSWGPAWGEKGYIRISAGYNTCNMKTYLMSNAIL